MARRMPMLSLAGQQIMDKVGLERAIEEGERSFARAKSVINRYVERRRQLRGEKLDVRRVHVVAPVAGKALLHARIANKRLRRARQEVVQHDRHAHDEIAQAVELRGLRAEVAAKRPDLGKKLGVGVGAAAHVSSPDDLGFQNPTAAAEAAHRLSETSK